MLGGILVQVWNWRATFWCMVILAGCSATLLLLFKETFRKERSLAYQGAKKRAMSRNQSRLQSTQLSRVHSGDLHAKLHPVSAEVAGHHHTTHHTPDQEWDEKGIPAHSDPKEVKIRLADINPLGPSWQVLKQRTNLAILFASGTCPLQTEQPNRSPLLKRFARSLVRILVRDMLYLCKDVCRCTILVQCLEDWSRTAFVRYRYVWKYPVRTAKS